jgi:NAD(P)-dependent dehydrogenase (short-subunit alcohol dehydrogenase family)
MKVNFISFVELVRLLSKKDNYNPGMSIVSMSSVSSLSGGPSVTAYASSKAAIDAAVRCLSKELYSKDIRLNSIIAGQVLTEAYNELMETKTATEDKVMQRQFLGAASTSDVVNVIVFLLSDRSKMITGKSIPVDGGYLS